MDLVRIKNVEKKYKNGVQAIYDLNLAIEQVEQIINKEKNIDN